VPHPSAAIDIQGTAVRLKRGAIDLGGLAKGWAVDRAAELLEGMGLDALVNAGGDLRAVGEEAPGAGGWMVAIERPDGTVMWEGTTNAALATSSAMRRRWPTTDGGWAHHLIDPRTGLPANSPYVQVTVAAERCLWAEVWSKAILIGGPETLQGASGNVPGGGGIRARRSAEPGGLFDKGPATRKGAQPGRDPSPSFTAMDPLEHQCWRNEGMNRRLSLVAAAVAATLAAMVIGVSFAALAGRNDDGPGASSTSHVIDVGGATTPSSLSPANPAGSASDPALSQEVSLAESGTNSGGQYFDDEHDDHDEDEHRDRERSKEREHEREEDD